MIALSIEYSTMHAGLALFEDEHLMGESSWTERSARKARLFTELPELLARCKVDVAAIHTFIVGRGPGSYSGLRSAITAGRSLALPGRRTVFAVGSGEALAMKTAEAEQAQTVAVLGDARRRMLWVGVFRARGVMLEVLKPWTVIRMDELPDALREPCVAVSPDWSHMGSSLAGLNLPQVRWISENRYPCAADVGRLGLLKLGSGLPSEPLTPIYTHPPVG